MLRFVIVVAIASPFAFAGCHEEPQPVHAGEADLPPLPPSSGTPVGYLLDARQQLKLSADQITKLQQIDSSLAARNAEIDTQLRELEESQPQPQQDPHEKPHPVNLAPGANGPPTGDAARLHDIRNSNDRDAIRQAWALLDKTQQDSAARILEDRGVQVPGERKAAPKQDEAGTPVPGI